MSHSGIFPTDDWTVAQGQTKLGPIITRFRSGHPDPLSKQQFTKLVIVKWAYEPRDDSGLPDPDTIDAMAEFEDRILEATDASGNWGSGVAVITHDGVREWRFYTPDVDRFVTEFSEALSGLGPYPLNLQAFDDPEWGAFSEIKSMSESDG